MEDFPRDLLEFEARFATEKACREYLFQLRWPDGFCCPRCGGRKGWPKSEALLQCAGCNCQSPVTAGTIFQDTRKPLTLWFRAAWRAAAQKNGASAMVRPGRDRLTGRVEVDETCLGGLEEGVRGRQTDAKALIAVAAQEDGPAIGRIRMRPIADASAQSLIPFVEDSAEPGGAVHTDGWLGYPPLEGKGYAHEAAILKGKKKTPSEPPPRVHRAIPLLKRRLMGTHRGAVSLERLDYDLDEFTFRFNRRKSRSRGKLFFRLLQQAVAVDPAPYKSMVKCHATAASAGHKM